MAKRKRTQAAQATSSQPENSLLPQVIIKIYPLVSSCMTPFFFQKKHYRQRAHANPFSDHSLDYPSSPGVIHWASHYPAFHDTGKIPEFADIGCGFGGLLIALAPLFPDVLMLG